MNGSPYDPTARIGGIDFLRSTLDRVLPYADPGKGTVTRRNRLAHEIERFRRLDGILDPGDVAEILDALRLAGPVASLAADLSAASVDDNRRTGDEIHRLREEGWQIYARLDAAYTTAEQYARLAVSTARNARADAERLEEIGIRLRAVSCPVPAWRIDPPAVFLDDDETSAPLDLCSIRNGGGVEP